MTFGDRMHSSINIQTPKNIYHAIIRSSLPKEELLTNQLIKQFMKTKNIFTGLFFSLSLAAASSHADTDVAALKNAIPEMKNIEEAKTLPGGDLIEVRIGKSEIIYVTSDFKYGVKGEIIDLKTKKNITRERISELTKINFEKLNLANAIKIQKGDGSKKFASFEDPNCGYCKKLTKEVLAMNDVSVYVFLIPILGHDSEIKSKNIWCARDKEKTYINWMIDNITPPNVDDCHSEALKQNKVFALEAGIKGTPAIIFPDGRINSGVLPAQEIQKRLSK